MLNDDEDDELDIIETDMIDKIELLQHIILNEHEDDEVIGILDDELDDELDVILLQIELQLIDLEYDEQLSVEHILMLE